MDIHWRQRALRQAEEGNTTPGGSPIGCVIVYEGKVIGEGFNEADIHCDPSAHAEIVAMRRAGKQTSSRDFRGATLYTTLQPCGRCSMASIWAKVGRIVYGAGRGDVHSSYLRDRHMNKIDFIQMRTAMTIHARRRSRAAMRHSTFHSTPIFLKRSSSTSRLHQLALVPAFRLDHYAITWECQLQ
jgi:tRNA(adenine34) deaminase